MHLRVWLRPEGIGRRCRLSPAKLRKGTESGCISASAWSGSALHELGGRAHRSLLEARPAALLLICLKPDRPVHDWDCR